MLTIENRDLINITEITQDIYDNALQGIDFKKVECCCSTAGDLIKIGSYLRCFKTPTKKTHIRIQRVMCKHCGRTHAVFIECMVPSSMLLIGTQIKMLRSYYNNTIDEFLHSFPTIDVSNVLHIVKNFKYYWKRFLRNSNLTLYSDSETLISYFFFNYKLQFMQMKRSSIILHVDYHNNLI